MRSSDFPKTEMCLNMLNGAQSPPPPSPNTSAYFLVSSSTTEVLQLVDKIQTLGQSKRRCSSQSHLSRCGPLPLTTCTFWQTVYSPYFTCTSICPRIGMASTVYVRKISRDLSKHGAGNRFSWVVLEIKLTAAPVSISRVRGSQFTSRTAR